MLDLEFSNFTVKGSPNFIPVDGNADHLLLEFEIERNDYSKNWANSQNIFKGSLELKKVRDGKEVKLVVTHTANETKYVKYGDLEKIKCTRLLEKLKYNNINRLVGAKQIYPEL